MTGGAFGTLPKQTQRSGTNTILSAGSDKQQLLYFQANFCMVMTVELT